MSCFAVYVNFMLVMTLLMIGLRVIYMIPVAGGRNTSHAITPLINDIQNTLIAARGSD